MRKLILFVLLLLPSSYAGAQHFSTTNLQFLYGTGFTDNFYGNNTSSETMRTITMEHFTDFGKGDVFFFADYADGNFLNFIGQDSGESHRIYSELMVHVSPLRLAGIAPTGFVKDVQLAASFERGSDSFFTELYGVGFNLKVPGFNVSTIDVLYRNDVFNDPTYQITAAWNATIPIPGFPLEFGGFADFNGTDENGLNILTQPQLLYTPPKSPISVGAELYYHHNNDLDVLAPQAMVRWKF